MSTLTVFSDSRYFMNCKPCPSKRDLELWSQKGVEPEQWSIIQEYFKLYTAFREAQDAARSALRTTLYAEPEAHQEAINAYDLALRVESAAWMNLTDFRFKHGAQEWDYR